MLMTITISSILTDIGSVITFIMGLFGDLITAVTSNPWLLISILIGFGGTALALVWRQIRKARHL